MAMSFPILLARIAYRINQSILPGSSTRKSRKSKTRIWVEQLEDRTVPSLFGPAVNYSVGQGPYSVALGDFNGDHKLDIVTANQNSVDVSVLFGNGNGTFQAPVSLFSGSQPIFVIAADLNGDGKDDIVAGNNSGASITVLLSNGDGTFQGAVQYSTAGQTVGITTGDFNGDGKMDLAVANQSSVVSVLFGNGDGTFQSAMNYNVGTFAREVATGDFNRDGHLDIIVADQGDNGVSTLINQGDGIFVSTAFFPTGSTPTSVKTADLNGDGKMDVVTANFGSNDISVLLGNGDGTFQGMKNYAAGSNPHNLAIGDINGDGMLDITVADRSGGVSVLLGNGDGTFQAPQSFATDTGGSLGVAIGDLNGDGAPDLVTANHDNNDISVLLNSNSTKPITVTGVVINDGSVQRSMINSITISFSGQVTIDPGAFQLAKQSGGQVTVLVATSTVNGHTVAVLSFAGNDINGGSLSDGIYTLTIQGDHIHDGTGQALDGDGNGSPGGNKVVTFSRLFGDANGDGVVDSKDLAIFQTTFNKKVGDPGFLWYFDFDGNGVVNSLDKKQFDLRRKL
jgi:hypothetical protein